MEIDIINPYALKIIISARDEDSINAISKRTGISFGWAHKWVIELAKAGVFKLTRMKLTINKQSEFYKRTIRYIKTVFAQDTSFYYSVLSWMGITYCFTKTDAVFIWTKGGYQVGRSRDYYPIFIKIKKEDKEVFGYYARKLGLNINKRKGIFYKPEYLESFAFEFCDDIPVDSLKETAAFMKKYIYNFEPALEMVQEMYNLKLGVKYKETETNVKEKLLKKLSQSYGIRKVSEMRNLEYLQSTLSQHMGELRKEYMVKDIGIFGSAVRGEQKKTSDIDILVEFRRPIGFFKFLELEEYLSKLLGRKVDLVSKKALKPRIGQHILKEVVKV